MKNPIVFVAALCVWLSMAGCVDSPRDKSARTPDRRASSLFETLRALDKPGAIFAFHDFHGNAVEPLLQLMIGRFENTRAICRELDSPKSKELKKYRKALFRALGAVKDPASIPWLKKQLRTNHEEIAELWLPRWGTYGLRGAEIEELPWLTGTDKWEQFFSQWANDERDQAIRSRVIQVIHSWIHSPKAVTYFQALEANPETSDHDYLLAELYLFQHGKRGDRARFQAAIDRLSKSEINVDFLKQLAEEMCDEAFLPWLLQMVEDKPKEEYGNYQWLLERITFQRDRWGSSEWKAWASTNLSNGRELWRQRATEQLIALAQTNRTAARAFMDASMYRWKSPDTIGSMEQLIVHKDLHDGIVGWINLTYAHYHHVPGLRNRLRALAMRIQSESGSSLEPWAKRLMVDWDFLHEQKKTWRAFVVSSNMRM